MGFAIFVKEHMYLTVFFSSAFQVIGTLILGLFSFCGLKIETSDKVFEKGKGITHVSVDTKWLNWARFGLLLLIVGIFLGGMASLAGVAGPSAG
jgi:heme A synthase